MLRTSRIMESLQFASSHTLGVLLVDPDPNHLALWGSLLSYVGYRVFCARSAFEATLWLSRDVHCVVLSDRLPDFEPLEYVERLALPGVREFVLLIGENTPVAAVRATNAGAGAVLSKAAASLQEMVDAIEFACRHMPHARPVHVEPSWEQSEGESATCFRRSA